MKKNLEIQDFEDKKTKNGKRFTRFKTSGLAGDEVKWLSCFDEDQCTLIKKFEHNTACCEVMKSGEFYNIKKCYGSAQEIDEQDNDMQEVEVIKPKYPVETKVSKFGTMYISYAKDLLCYTYMSYDDAVETIEKLKEHFKGE